MISKIQIKSLICLQKIAARKSIALQNIKITKINPHEQYSLFRIIADERKFLSNDFNSVKDINNLMEIIHKTRHITISKTNNYTKCKYCKEIFAEMAIELPGAPAEYESIPNNDELQPRFGNLLVLLQQEVQNEINIMERRRIPSQNDLTRWALKETVLIFYQKLKEQNNIQDDSIIINALYADRLITQFAPDFDVIYKMWMDKLNELQRRDDKYTLNINEYDKAEEDLLDGMRGSAFEKQLDRYRDEFMNKLKR